MNNKEGEKQLLKQWSKDNNRLTRWKTKMKIEQEY
jgi:hypothetical protein